MPTKILVFQYILNKNVQTVVAVLNCSRCIHCSGCFQRLRANTFLQVRLNNKSSSIQFLCNPNFYSRLRNNRVADNKKFKADFTSIVTKTDEVQIHLINGANEKLLLRITWHDHTARLQLAEENNQRFTLMTGFSLEKEPTKTK